MAQQMLSQLTMSTNRLIAWLSSLNQMPQIGKWRRVLTPSYYSDFRSVVIYFMVGVDPDSALKHYLYLKMCCLKCWLWKKDRQEMLFVFVSPRTRFNSLTCLDVRFVAFCVLLMCLFFGCLNFMLTINQLTFQKYKVEEQLFKWVSVIIYLHCKKTILLKILKTR